MLLYVSIKTPPESYNVYNIYNFSDGPRAVQTAGGDAAQQQGEGQHRNPRLRHRPLRRRIEEGSLLVFDVKTAESLIAATTHAISSGLLKMVGVLPILDKEASSCTPILLKLNLALRSFWVAELIVVKPWTARMDTPHLVGGNIPFEDISFVAAEVSWAFNKLDALM